MSSTLTGPHRKLPFPRGIKSGFWFAGCFGVRWRGCDLAQSVFKHVQVFAGTVLSGSVDEFLTLRAAVWLIVLCFLHAARLTDLVASREVRHG